jgi:hypothetical protein
MSAPKVTLGGSGLTALNDLVKAALLTVYAEQT